MKEDETIEQKKTEEKEIENSLLRANLIEIDTLGELNHKLFDELQMIAEQIENKSTEMFKLCFSEDEVKKLAEGDELSFQFKIENTTKKETFVKYWENTFNKLDNKFVADNFFLFFNNISELTELSEKEQKKADDSLYWADTLMTQKEEMLNNFDKLQEEIEKNNRKLSEYEKELFQKLKKQKIDNNEMIIREEISEEQSKAIIEIVAHTSKARISDIDIFELYDRTLFQIKFSADIKKNDDVIIFTINLKREANYHSGTYSWQQKQEQGQDFKDIKLKTQAVSMYKPTEIIFLEGEDIAKVYKEQAIVTIPFGLKAENENEVTYQITKLNYEQSDKDLRFFNACVSAQWNLLEHKLPINTFIEEATLYQIYIGDTSFTYRPKKEELEKMKNSILGMNSNQARMEFQSSYGFLSKGQRVKYISEGTILPVTYKSIIYEGKNGQKYSRSGYVFSEMIPLFSFMYELKEINSAPLQIESFLKSSQMNDEITRILKKEIAQLYFFKNNAKKRKKNIETGFQRRVYVTSNGEELTPKQWGEKSVEYKQQGKVLRGFWKYYTTRKIDSLIKNCKFTKKNGEILHVNSEKNLDRKTYSRFIDSVITFLRESKKIQYANGNYIKDFILYDKRGNIVKDSDYHTENEKKRLKNKRSTRSQERLKSITSKKNPSIDKIDIIITDS